MSSSLGYKRVAAGAASEYSKVFRRAPHQPTSINNQKRSE